MPKPTSMRRPAPLIDDLVEEAARLKRDLVRARRALDRTKAAPGGALAHRDDMQSRAAETQLDGMLEARTTTRLATAENQFARREAELDARKNLSGPTHRSQST